MYMHTHARAPYTHTCTSQTHAYTYTHTGLMLLGAMDVISKVYGACGVELLGCRGGDRQVTRLENETEPSFVLEAKVSL